ncbi:MAG: hypothetical protein KY464_07885 [Gemmatimonadetes bacterium]|nr:hypothetical protein [Gemmatimonadota bacterium]
MSYPEPTAHGIAARELSARLFVHLAGESPVPASTAAAVESVCQRLRAELTATLGSGGASALLVRALHLATREHPLLAGVTVGNDPHECLTALSEAISGRSDQEAAAAGAAIFTHLFILLVTFLGEDLGLQPLFKFWPHLARGVEEIEG